MKAKPYVVVGYRPATHAERDIKEGEWFYEFEGELSLVRPKYSGASTFRRDKIRYIYWAGGRRPLFGEVLLIDKALLSKTSRATSEAERVA